MVNENDLGGLEVQESFEREYKKRMSMLLTRLAEVRFLREKVKTSIENKPQRYKEKKVFKPQILRCLKEGVRRNKQAY